MPNRPRNPCTTPGCDGRSVAGGRCGKCRTRRRVVADAERGATELPGYDHVWRARRLDYLIRYPWCVLCPQAATVADHYPISRRDLFAMGVVDVDADHRLRPLCALCHNRETARNQPGGWNRRGRGRATR